MESISDFETKADHRMIFDELKGIREDLHKVMTITREEMNKSLSEIKNDIADVKKSHIDTDRIARESLLIAQNARTVIWAVGGVVILMIGTSFWKYIGGG